MRIAMEDGMEFSKLSAPSLKELFINQIQGKILEGKLTVGEKLPSERELSAQMQVSRAVVNTGLAELSDRGFLEVRPRQGVYVADFRRNGNMKTLVAMMEYNSGTLADSEIKAILEVRRALEHEACREAIASGTEQELLNLAQIVEDIRHQTSPNAAAEIAFRFQLELAIVSRNSIIRMIYGSFKAPVILLWVRYCERYGVLQLYRNLSHLVDCMRERDNEKTHAHIDEYLQDSISGRRQIYNIG